MESIGEVHKIFESMCGISASINVSTVLIGDIWTCNWILVPYLLVLGESVDLLQQWQRNNEVETNGHRRIEWVHSWGTVHGEQACGEIFENHEVSASASAPLNVNTNYPLSIVPVSPANTSPSFTQFAASYSSVCRSLSTFSIFPERIGCCRWHCAFSSQIKRRTQDTHWISWSVRTPSITFVWC